MHKLPDYILVHYAGTVIHRRLRVVYSRLRETDQVRINFNIFKDTKSESVIISLSSGD